MNVAPRTEPPPVYHAYVLEQLPTASDADILPGLIANQCPDSDGSLVGGVKLRAGSPSFTVLGQQGWLLGSPADGGTINNFTVALDNPSGLASDQAWGLEKVVVVEGGSRTGSNAWRLTRGFRDTGTCPLAPTGFAWTVGVSLACPECVHA